VPPKQRTLSRPPSPPASVRLAAYCSRQAFRQPRGWPNASPVSGSTSALVFRSGRCAPPPQSQRGLRASPSENSECGQRILDARRDLLENLRGDDPILLHLAELWISILSLMPTTSRRSSPNRLVPAARRQSTIGFIFFAAITIERSFEPAFVGLPNHGDLFVPWYLPKKVAYLPSRKPASIIAPVLPNNRRSEAISDCQS